MLLHTEYAEVSDVGANALFPVKLRLKPTPLFTRRFEAQLHWCPVTVERPDSMPSLKVTAPKPLCWPRACRPRMLAMKFLAPSSGLRS